MSAREPAAPAPADRACVVCVPARDEAERLPRLLAALARQDGFSPAAPLRVLVLANNCTDDTAGAVHEAAGALDALAVRLVEARLAGAQAHVGTARRMALDAGADWLEADGHPDGALLSTDADVEMPADWVAANLLALRSADAVGGRLVIEEDVAEAADPRLADLHARIERYWAGVRRLEDLLDPPPHDPAPRHGDHTGASLALPAALYRAVGGLPPLPCGEDNALVARLREHGARLRHCPRVRVTPSSRRQGRVAGGMATEMIRRAGVLADPAAYRLPEAAHWRALILRRAALRRAFALPGPARAEACARLGLEAADLAAVLAAGCPNDIAFVERADRVLEGRCPPARDCPLDEALADLDALARSPRAAA